MCYALTDNNFYIGKDDHGRPTTVSSMTNAMKFKTLLAAENYVKCIPDTFRKYDWFVLNVDDSVNENNEELPVTRHFGNPTLTTTLEEDEFDICEFFTSVIDIMSQIDRFISNMTDNEQIVDMKILDVRHYIRNNNHKLNAIQMQRLGYYLQDLEKERYGYKSKRLIASMFANNIDALKNKSNINKMNSILTSHYRPKVLDDTDIEYIINKKKDDVSIA